MLRRIWIIGASSGIGLALANELIAQGHSIVLSGRHVDALRSLAAADPARIITQPCDVTVATSVAEAVERISEHWGAIDVVIYNAGICEYVDDGQIMFDSCQRVMDSNFFGLVRCCEKSLPLLQRGNLPQLIAVSSSAAFIALPRAEFYGASKAAMSYFLNSLRLAWSHKGISVQIVHPGFVKTPLTDKNDFAMPFMISAQDAAQRIVRGIERRRTDIHFPRRFTLILKFMALLPIYIQQQFTKRLIEK